MSTGAKLGIGAAVVAATLVVGVGIGGSGGNASSQAADGPVQSSASAPASITPSAKPSPAASKTAAAAEATEPAADEVTDDEESEAQSAAYGEMPKQQREFVKAVSKAQEVDTENELKLGKALSKRNKAICKVLASRSIKNWSGKIVELDANNDGKGIVSIEIAEDVHISTWNNAFSDMFDNTLIEPGSLFDDFLEHEEGDIVRFSGKFADGDDVCVNDSRITLSGKLQDPDFIFKFRSVKAG